MPVVRVWGSISSWSADTSYFIGHGSRWYQWASHLFFSNYNQIMSHTLLSPALNHEDRVFNVLYRVLHRHLPACLSTPPSLALFHCLKSPCSVCHRAFAYIAYPGWTPLPPFIICLTSVQIFWKLRLNFSYSKQTHGLSYQGQFPFYGWVLNIFLIPITILYCSSNYMFSISFFHMTVSSMRGGVTLIL